jgi:hypothetical protein
MLADESTLMKTTYHGHTLSPQAVHRRQLGRRDVAVVHPDGSKNDGRTRRTV